MNMLTLLPELTRYELAWCVWATKGRGVITDIDKVEPNQIALHSREQILEQLQLREKRSHNVMDDELWRALKSAIAKLEDIKEMSKDI